MSNEAEETSLREDLEASMAELSTPEAEPVVESVHEANGNDEGGEEGGEESAPPAREGRDNKGRFAPKKAAAPVGAADPAAGAKPAETAAPPVAPTGQPVPGAEVKAEPAERPPQSWKPLAREHWAVLPQEVRAEVVRREQEVSRVLQESAQARRAADQFHEAVRPYEQMIRAEAGDPIRAISGLLQTAYQLRNAPPNDRAKILAQLVHGYGVPIDALDAALAGQPMAQQGHQPAPYDPRVDQLMQRLEQAENQRKAAVFESAQASVQEFAGDKEFFEDLREDIADVLELAAKRKQKMSLSDAYERAVALRPDIQKIVSQREAAKSAAKAQASTQRSRVAASSIRSAPAVAPPRSSDGTSLREDIETAMRELQGR
jgi:hypothetical protein